jgi:hypothetical protein
MRRQLPGYLTQGPRHPARQQNLPEPASKLIGRDVELGEILDISTSHRLVTLTVAGGIGKTRLGFEAARNLLPRFADGGWASSWRRYPIPSWSRSAAVPVNPLALYPERFAAGGDHAHCRVGAQQRLGHQCRVGNHMLAIVEYQHQLLQAERVATESGDAAPEARSSPRVVATGTAVGRPWRAARGDAAGFGSDQLDRCRGDGMGSIKLRAECVEL